MNDAEIRAANDAIDLYVAGLVSTIEMHLDLGEHRNFTMTEFTNLLNNTAAIFKDCMSKRELQ